MVLYTTENFYDAADQGHYHHYEGNTDNGKFNFLIMLSLIN